MNLRCAFCQTPYTLGRTEKLIALQQMETEKLSHYDAHCPRCRRANSISRQRMELFLPNWQEAIKQLPAAPAMSMQSSMSAPASAARKTEPVSRAQKANAKPAVKPAAKKLAVKKPTAPAKKTTAKAKPASASKAKKAPAKGKKK